MAYGDTPDGLLKSSGGECYFKMLELTFDEVMHCGWVEYHAFRIVETFATSDFQFAAIAISLCVVIEPITSQLSYKLPVEKRMLSSH